ncbi:ABC transporter substrate-binding protein [Actinomadura rupiterrae]|uniref:ABC transporter substrate-binding protein n=1 Tax=Actinomadura rupiterrae TaxID=559627 RepID=UPI0020A59F90|nr:ABC transporter substrate-binding protein [Actinomadura rupiterrae]MCP2342628.1 peptide/nickel transport system substrate-binding protein [Actinomadura rupiterrae]
MKKIRPIAALAAGLVATTGLAACGGGSGGSNKGAGYNAATDKVINQSDKKGGTLRFAISDDFDSPDPGNTYYAWSQNFVRLYGRGLLTFKPAAGSESNQVVPDLAQGPGTPSDGGKTWTYKLRSGVKYDDGTPVTSKDVKYAVERSNFTDELQLGPKYFKAYLQDNTPAYKGPYKDKSPQGLKSIETPDDSTVIFHLSKPFSEFDYLVGMAQTIPVPQAKDKGLKYEQAIVSSGPYKIDSYQRGKSMTLSRNPNWDPSTDPIRKALPDRIELQLKQSGDDIDNRLLAGSLDVDAAGVGVQSGTQGKLLSDQTKKANTDNPLQGYLRFASMNLHVAPLDNVHCRRAVQYATDKVAMQSAYGGPLAGGDVATTILPPSIVGYTKFDKYPQKYKQGGGLDDSTLAQAKSELQQCGKPTGFKTKISARSDRPKEVAMAQAMQQGLKQVGIQTEIVQYPAGDYFNKYVGAPKFVHDNGVGIMLMAWSADWPTGYGFLSQILDGRAIKPSGGNNLPEENNQKINDLFDQAIGNTDKEARAKIYGQIDQMAMDDAVDIPIIYAKALLYRPPNVTNVGITQGYGGMYDYLNMGVKK